MPAKPSLDRTVHPNLHDYQMTAKLTRTSATPVMIPVIVNDARVELPAIHAQGDFFGGIPTASPPTASTSTCPAGARPR